MKKNKLAYIASKVATYLKDEPKDKIMSDEAFLAITDNAARIGIEAKRLGYIPISTPIAFSKIYIDGSERDLLMSNCYQVIKICDAFFYDGRELAESRGVTEELDFARKLGLEIIDIHELQGRS